MKKQRFLLILMTILIAVMVMPTSVFAFEGKGTAASPYLISDEADLTQVRNYPDGYFKLEEDIVLSSAWSPIGNETTPFEGVFDGNGHTISGLAINASGSDVFVGLFGYSKGDIKNLNVKISGISVTARENAYVGGIVAFNNRGTVSNSYAEGTIKVNSATTLNESNIYAGMIAGKSTGPISASRAYGSIEAAASATTAEKTSSNPIQIYAGGIVGLIDKSIKNCSAAVDITAISNSSTKYSSAEAYAGGIAGETIGDIENSFAAGNVYAESTSSLTEAYNYAGGLVGKTTGNISTTTAVGDIKAKTNATGAGTYAGGLIGYSTGSVANSYSNGKATAENSLSADAAYAGGLIGLSGGNIINCYASQLAEVKASGSAMPGGLVGYTSKLAANSYFAADESYAVQEGCGTAKTKDELKLSATYSDWDFSNVWGISAGVNNGYPTLKIMPVPTFTLASAEYTYDKTQKTLTATNVSDGVTVIYKNNSATAAGSYAVTAIEKKADNTFAVAAAELKINKKTVNVKDIVALEKDYDGTTVAQIDATAATIEGVIEGDEVILDTSNATATFAASEPGENITVTVTGLELKGKDAGNYQIAPYTTTATILEKCDATLSYNNGTVTIDAYRNINNAYVVIVSYYNDLVVDYDLIDKVTVEAGKLTTRTVKTNFKVISGGKVKAMLWADLTNIKPLAKFVSADIQ